MIGTLLVCLVVGYLAYVIKKYWTLLGVWKGRGIPEVSPFTYLSDYFLKKKSLPEICEEIAFAHANDPVVGMINFSTPVLLINDLEYAEIVLVKEFSSFMNRGEDVPLREKRPLDKHLFFLTGSEWKAVRTKLTPVFTTNKLRGMQPEIERIFDRTFSELSTSAVDLQNVIEKFTLRVRASCVFGIDLTDSTIENEFIAKVNSMSEMSVMSFVKQTIALWFPRLAKVFDLSLFGADNEKYFVDILLNAFKKRREMNIVKNDFMQTLMELKQKGKVEVQQWTQEDNYLNSEHHTTVDTVEIDDDILVSQCFIFLVAGLETLISTLTLLLVELARNPEALHKLRQEIDAVYDKHKEFSYQALKDMEYLEKCIKETLRMYAPAEVLLRHCCRPLTLPNGLRVDKGCDIFIPVTKFHHDPDLYPDPFNFNPDRFSHDSHPSSSYLPFGYGPRICIGLRMAMMEMKTFASKMIHNYDLELDPRTEFPIRTDKWFFLRKNISPIFMAFKPRNKGAAQPQ